MLLEYLRAGQLPRLDAMAAVITVSEHADVINECVGGIWQVRALHPEGCYSVFDGRSSRIEHEYAMSETCNVNVNIGARVNVNGN